jgi:gas vesicle protein
MSSGKLITGLLVGATAGAVLGILFAPKRGKTTRKRIARMGEDFSDSLKSKFNEVLETVSEKIEKVKEEVSGFAEKKKA